MLKWIGMASALALITACGGAGDKPAETPTDTGQTPPDASLNEGHTPGYNADRNAYFGDMHIHTRNSFDAYIFNVRANAEDAYRFAKGETIKHPSGFDMTIAGGPLDFYTVTDHAEYLGILPAMDTEGNPSANCRAQRTCSLPILIRSLRPFRA